MDHTDSQIMVGRDNSAMTVLLTNAMNKGGSMDAAALAGLMNNKRDGFDGVLLLVLLLAIMNNGGFGGNKDISNSGVLAGSIANTNANVERGVTQILSSTGRASSVDSGRRSSVADLSVLIPSRNEMWLKRTVEDVLRNAKADTGRCVRVCFEVQNIGAIDFTNRGFSSIVTTPYNKGLNISDCILCGQCILVCPTAALREKSTLKEVSNALTNKNKFKIVQIAPAVRASLGEEYNMPLGTDVTGQLVTGLRRLGFKKVFDTNFAADLTIMEEATELMNRVQNNKPLPMFTSCCPGWVKYVEQNKPEILDHVSTCKSPHEMEGAVLKTYYA